MRSSPATPVAFWRIRGRAPAWTIPGTAALADADGKPFVWKLNPDTMTVSKVSVELGEMTGDKVLIAGGVEPGEVVAISGARELRDGMKVRQMN